MKGHGRVLRLVPLHAKLTGFWLETPWGSAQVFSKAHQAQKKVWMSQMASVGRCVRLAASAGQDTGSLMLLKFIMIPLILFLFIFLQIITKKSNLNTSNLK